MMGRSRPVRQWGAALALFALWLQLVLSFAHIHPEDFFPPVPVQQASLPGLPGAPAAPAKPAPANPDHDDCAICVSMAMAAASALPAPILLVPPSPDYGISYVRIAHTPALAAAPRPPFQTRAPPSA
jgi:hypothetical protein